MGVMFHLLTAKDPMVGISSRIADILRGECSRLVPDGTHIASASDNKTVQL